MPTRSQRLKKLAEVQAQLKALHETRHAGHVASASRAAEEAADLVARFDATDSLSGLFPELYHNRIGKALQREQASLAAARIEAGRVATATARANRVERAWRDAARWDERTAGDRERLDMLAQLTPEDDRK